MVKIFHWPFLPLANFPFEDLPIGQFPTTGFSLAIFNSNQFSISLFPHRLNLHGQTKPQTPPSRGPPNSWPILPLRTLPPNKLPKMVITMAMAIIIYLTLKMFKKRKLIEKPQLATRLKTQKLVHSDVLCK